MGRLKSHLAFFIVNMADGMKIKYRWRDDVHIIAYNDGTIDLAGNFHSLRIRNGTKFIETMLEATAKTRGLLIPEQLTQLQSIIFKELEAAGMVYLVSSDKQIADLAYSINRLTNYQLAPRDNINIARQISRVFVCIIGTGVLTSWLAPHLAILNKANFMLIDYDTVQYENLGRGPLFNSETMGVSKVEVFSKYITSRSPKTVVSNVLEKICKAEQLDALVSKHPIDLMILTADEPPKLLAEIVSRVSVKRSIPAIRASRLGVGPIYHPSLEERCLSCEFKQNLIIDEKQVATDVSRHLNAKVRKSQYSPEPARVAAELFEHMLKVLILQKLDLERHTDAIEALGLSPCGNRQELRDIQGICGKNCVFDGKSQS
jgi:hypothetical protein